MSHKVHMTFVSFAGQIVWTQYVYIEPNVLNLQFLSTSQLITNNTTNAIDGRDYFGLIACVKQSLHATVKLIHGPEKSMRDALQNRIDW